MWSQIVTVFPVSHIFAMKSRDLIKVQYPRSMSAEANVGHRGVPEPNGVSGHHGAVNITYFLMMRLERGPQAHTLILTAF